MRVPSQGRSGAQLLLALALILIAHALYLPAKAMAAQFLLELAWHRTVVSGEQHKPWPWADTTTLAQIQFPDQDERFILLAGSVGRTLAFAPGHLSGSSLPGERGHMVISAHRDTHFAVLEEVEVGHRIEVLAANGRRQRYMIQTIRIVDSRHEQLQLSHGEDRLTLVTCYPFDALESGALRLRVDAISVEA